MQAMAGNSGMLPLRQPANSASDKGEARAQMSASKVPRTMDDTAENRQMRWLRLGLAGCILALVVCGAYLWGALGRIDQLENQQEDTHAALAGMRAEAAKRRSETDGVVADYRSRISALEAALARSPAALAPPSRQDLDALAPGVYVLQTSTAFDPEADGNEPYTITHAVVELQYDDYGTKLHVGIATSGWLPSGVYFDYNNDGEVDADMALSFVRDIPVIGGRLVRAYDPRLSQNLYAIFISESANAEYTSIDDMTGEAEAASSYVWRFIVAQYETIEAWVMEQLAEDEAGDQPPAGF